MDGRQADLKVVFGRDGIWAELLKHAPGYIATQVECESHEERRYRVKDIWIWHRYFERFRERFATEYEKFEQLLVSDGVIERQQFVGAYYEKEPGNGDELVPG